jgi:2-dehydro-3-deoxygluconokinase
VTLDILSMGEAMVEFNAAGPAVEGASYVQGYGGDTSNAAIAAARQGARAGYLTAVGADLFGEVLLSLWRREGVDTAGVKRDPAAPTGIYFVTHGPKGHAFTYYRTGSAASRLAPADIAEAAITRTRILHASGISLAISESAEAAVERAIALARRNGIKVSFDTNLRLKLWPLERARAAIHRTIARADIALPSLDDARLLTGREEADAIVDFYLELGVPLVALKLGAEGCIVADRNGRRRIPGHEVEAVDATGAGDTFAGAFLARTVAGDDPFSAAAYANAAAALSTTGYGAVAPIPRRAEVERLLAAAHARATS